jgi:FtsH-binding integral membrane protein
MRGLRVRISNWIADRPGAWRNLSPLPFANFWYVRYPTAATVYALLMIALVIISAAYGLAIRPVLLPYGFWIFVLLLFASCVHLLSVAWRPKSIADVDEYLRDRRRYPRLAVLFFAPWIVALLFGCTSYLGWCAYGDKFMLARNDSDLWDWAAYVADNFIRVALLDLAETYHFRASDIEHANAMWPATFVFMFRSLLSLSLVSYGMAVMKRLRQKDWSFARYS